MSMGSKNSSSAPDAPPPQRVICYGDSLTEGYTIDDDGRLDFKPYAAELKAASQGKYVGIQYGVSGELSGKILWRLQFGLEEKASRPDFQAQGQQEGENKGGPTIIPGDHVVLLAGSNDLGHDFGAGEIFENIKKMVSEILTGVPEPGPRTIILCTIPPLSTRNEMSRHCRTLRENRAAANRMIVEYVRSLQPVVASKTPAASPAEPTTQFKLLDIYSRMSEVPAMFSEEELEESREVNAGPGEVCWPPPTMPKKWAADHIHFNTDGYKRIAADVVTLLNGEEIPGPCRIPPEPAVE